MKDSKPIEFYHEQVSKMITITIIRSFIKDSSCKELSDILWRIFHKKERIVNNIAKYVKVMVEEKDKNIDDVLNSVSFFAFILKEYAYKNIGQPINK
jgi:hypothetical protein